MKGPKEKTTLITAALEGLVYGSGFVIAGQWRWIGNARCCEILDHSPITNTIDILLKLTPAARLQESR